MTNDYKLTPEQQKLVEDNINLVYGVIADKFDFLYNLPEADFQDMEQAGKLALCKAAKQYSPQKSKFSTFAYIVIRQDLSDLITKLHLISEQESFANDLMKQDKDESDFSRPADFSAYFVDKGADGFSSCGSVDIKNALDSFFADSRVTDKQKVFVKAFLLTVLKGYSATEAGLIMGAKNSGSARNIVAKGREILKNRKEFRGLWEKANVKSLAS